jgi:hypothetical protein
MACGPFFNARAIGTELHDRAVQAHRFDLGADNLLFLHLFEQLIQHAVKTDLGRLPLRFGGRLLRRGLLRWFPAGDRHQHLFLTACDLAWLLGRLRFLCRLCAADALAQRADPGASQSAMCRCQYPVKSTDLPRFIASAATRLT